VGDQADAAAALAHLVDGASRGRAGCNGADHDGHS